MVRHPSPARRCAPRLGLALLLLLSCSRQQSRTEALTGPLNQDRERLTLAQIEPRPTLPPASRPVEDASVSDEAAALFKTARDAFDAKQWTDAVEAAERAVAEHPDFLAAHLLIARAAIHLDNLTTAKVHAEKAREIAPRNTEACLLSGDVAAREGRTDDAIRDYRIALLVSEDRPLDAFRVTAHLRLSEVLAKAHYLNAAADELDAYLAGVDHPAEGWPQHEELTRVIKEQRGTAAARLGDLRARLDQHSAAVTAYRRAVAESPENRKLLGKLAISLARAGQNNEAIDAARTLLADARADLDDLEVLRDVCTSADRADAYTEIGIRMLAPIVGAEPAAPAAVTLATLYSDKMDAAESLNVVMASLKASPESGESFERFFTRLDSMFARERFVPVSAMLSEKNASDACAVYLHGRILAAAGALDEAKTELKRALGLKPPLACAGLALADLFIRAKAWTAAQDCLEELEKTHADTAGMYRLQLMKGVVHGALGDRAEAEAAYLRAAELAPREPEPLYQLSILCERAEDRRQCEAIYRRLLTSVDPRFVPAREKLVILLLNSDRREEAERFFDDFADLGITDPAVGRCRAMFNLADNKTDDGAKRLEDYRADLWRLLEDCPDDAPTLISLALSYLATGDYESAAVQADRAVALNPQDVRAREIQATLDAKLLRFDAAAATIRGLLEDRPRDVAYYQKLMEFSINVGDYDTAIEVVRTLMSREDLRAGRGLFIAQLIELLLMDKRDDDAVREAKAWLDEDPADGPRREAYVTTLGSAERYDEAIEAVQCWLADDPGNARLRRSLVSLMQSAERYVEAEQQVLAWLERTPDDIDLNRILIALFWAHEEWDAAVEVAQTCAELPESGSFYEGLLGQTYVFAKRYDRALELYRKRAGETQAVAAYRDLIALLIQADRLIEAEQIASKILLPELARQEQNRPYDPALIVAMRQYLSRIYQLLNRNDDAIQQLEAIHRLTPGDPGINNDLGYTYLEADMNLDEAEHMIRMAVAEQPRQSAYLDSLGWLLYKRGRFMEAVIYLQRAVDFAAGGDPVMCDHLADAFYRAGRTVDAGDAWREAAELCEPGKGRSLAPEDAELAENIRKKLAQLAADEPVDVASLAGKSRQPTTQSTSRPADDGPPNAEPEPEGDAPPPEAPQD